MQQTWWIHHLVVADWDQFLKCIWYVYPDGIRAINLMCGVSWIFLFSIDPWWLCSEREDTFATHPTADWLRNPISRSANLWIASASLWIATWARKIYTILPKQLQGWGIMDACGCCCCCCCWWLWYRYLCHVAVLIVCSRQRILKVKRKWQRLSFE